MEEQPMKLCVCGKGGSGKSTVVALLAGTFRSRGKRVLVVDADESNAGLYWMLGFDQPPTSLIELAGGKKNVRRALRAALSNDGDYQAVPLLARDRLRTEDLPPEFVRRAVGLELVCIGKIHQSLQGCACPMGVLSREFLKKLQMGPDQVVLADMAAGVEHFGRGVEASIDVVLAVVEPSLESVSLAERIRELTASAGARFAGAVLNKVDSEETATRLADVLSRREISALATIPFRWGYAEAALVGQAVTVGEEAAEEQASLDALLAALSATARD
jgi:CO dehydrogenase maturation factor